MIFYLVSKKVMICAGESSGELYGASLSRQLKKNWPDIKIFGIGGSRMKSEGVSLIAPITHILGIVEVLKHLFEIRRTFKNLYKKTIKKIISRRRGEAAGGQRSSVPLHVAFLLIRGCGCVPASGLFMGSNNAPLCPSAA